MGVGLVAGCLASAAIAAVAASIVGFAHSLVANSVTGPGDWFVLGAGAGGYNGAIGGIVVAGIVAVLAEIADARTVTTASTYGWLAASVTALGSLLVTSFFALIWSGDQSLPAALAGGAILCLLPTATVTLVARQIGRWMWRRVHSDATDRQAPVSA